MRRREIIVRGEPERRIAMSWLRDLDLAKPARVTVERHRKRRSPAQNRLMWSWCQMVAEHVEAHTGMDRHDVHLFFKARFCPPKALELGGEWLETRSTTLLNTAEMTAYIDAIYRFAVQELGLILPTPGLWDECGGDMAIVEERTRNGSIKEVA